MILNFLKSFCKMIKFQTKAPLPQTKIAFRALAEAIIPSSKNLSAEKASQNLSAEKEAILSAGALDLHVDEYQIWSLNHEITLTLMNKLINLRLANATAKMLNIAANKLIEMRENNKPADTSLLHEGNSLAALAPCDRIRVIHNLENLKVELKSLPLIFRYAPGFVLAITRVLDLLTVIGHYSEWSGYGSSRLETAEKRKLEHFPTGWKQVGYPGPSKGYADFRGNLIEKFTE